MFKPGMMLLALSVSVATQAATVDLRILETTDLHSNMMDFDYYKDTPTEKFGLVRTATLIHAARQEVKNSLLVDNGDIIQAARWVTTWRPKDYVRARSIRSTRRSTRWITASVTSVIMNSIMACPT